jgi:actin-like ATPase involved in cell morphogenesis
MSELLTSTTNSGIKKKKRPFPPHQPLARFAAPPGLLRGCCSKNQPFSLQNALKFSRLFAAARVARLLNQRLHDRSNAHSTRCHWFRFVFSSQIQCSRSASALQGIDLGESSSCCAVLHHNIVQVIPNAHGSHTTPSIVAFTDRERLIGEAARKQSTANPANTIFDSKRLIGRQFSDPDVQLAISQWPFRVLGREDENRPRIQVEYKGKNRDFLPEQIASMILKRMKRDAEQFVGSSVTHVVLTVPASYGDRQRQAAKETAALAELSALRVISEPTAACSAYDLDHDELGDIFAVVVDLGARTLDVSVMGIEDGIFENLANGICCAFYFFFVADFFLNCFCFFIAVAIFSTKHCCLEIQPYKTVSLTTDPIGGRTFTDRLATALAQDFKNQHETDPTSSPDAMRLLRSTANAAKHRLSTTDETPVDIESLLAKSLSTTTTRDHFNQLCQDLFEKILGAIDSTVQSANLALTQIHSVVLVGGATRMPHLRHLLHQHFPATTRILYQIAPEEVVAVGAAKKAAELIRDDSAIFSPTGREDGRTRRLNSAAFELEEFKNDCGNAQGRLREMLTIVDEAVGWLQRNVSSSGVAVQVVEERRREVKRELRERLTWIREWVGESLEPTPVQSPGVQGGLAGSVNGVEGGEEEWESGETRTWNGE